jgi:prepilin peptidase CpaA
MLIEAIRLTLFPVMLAFAAFSDLFTMTIANRVSLILAGGFVILALLTGMSSHDMLSHAGVAAAVLVVAFACFTQGWIGGGDAKLAAAAVLWLGVGHLADYLIYASLLGGALTIALIQYRVSAPSFGVAAVPQQRKINAIWIRLINHALTFSWSNPAMTAPPAVASCGK